VTAPVRLAALVLGLCVLATPVCAFSQQMDSQLVLQNYARALETIKTPPAQIFQYAVSQEGPSNLDQRHQVYRRGIEVRDETLAADGTALRPKLVRFGEREDRYAVGRVAPRAANYSFVFLKTAKNGARTDYLYETQPLEPGGAGFVVTGVAIDGRTFLPHVVRFKAGSGTVAGTGAIEYAPLGGYVVPVAASVAATLDGKPAREHISFGAYRFPPTLPSSTFAPPQPLQHASPPPN